MARGRRIDRIFYELGAEVEDFQSGMSQAEKSAKRLDGIITKYPMAAAGALAASLVAVGFQATVMAADLEQSMRKVGTQLNGGAAEVKQFQSDILSLYKELPVELNDLTEGLYELLSAEVPAEKAMETLAVSAKAAVGGMTTVGVVVDGMTTSLNAFSHSGITAQEVADKFHSSAKVGKTTFEEIAANIGSVAGIASALGLSLDDVLAPMTALTLRGVNTSEAFTALRGAMSNILKPTAEFKQQFPELAKEFNRSKLESVGLTQFLVEMAEKMEGNDSAVTALFGSIQAFNGVLSLTSDGGEKVTEILEKSKNSAGESAKAYDAMADSTNNLWKVTQNNFSASMIELGTILLPAVNDGLKAMVWLLEQISGSANRRLRDGFVEQITGVANAVSTEIEDIDKKIKVLDDRKKNRVGFRTKEFESRESLESRRKQEIQKVRRSLSAVVGGGGLTTDLTDEFFRGLTAQQATAMELGLKAVSDLDKTMASEQRAILNRNLARVRQTIAANATLPTADATPKATGKPDKKEVVVLTPEQKKAIEERAKLQKDMLSRAKDAAVKATETLVDDLRLELDRFDAEVVKTFGSLAKAPAEVVAQLNGIKNQLAVATSTEPLTKALDELTEKGKAASDSLALGVTSPTQEVISNYDLLISRIRSEMSVTSEGSDVYKELAKVLKDATTARAALSDAMINATPTQVDDIEAEIAALESLASKYEQVPADIAKAITEKKGALESVKLMEPIEKQLSALSDRHADAIEALEIGNRNLIESLIKDYDKQLAVMQEQLTGLNREDQAYKDLSASIRSVKNAKAGLQNLASPLADIEKIRTRARDIEEMARSVIQLGDAFGLLDASASKALQGIIQSSTQLKPFLAELSLFRSGAKGDDGKPLSSVGKVIGAGLPVIGGIASMVSGITGLFGESPEEKERRRIQKENTHAIEKLTKTVGEFGVVNVTGSQVSKYQSVLSDKGVQSIMTKYAQTNALGGMFGGIGTDQLSRALGSALTKAGLSYKDFAEFAKEFGITIDDTRIQFKNIQDVLEAINKAELAQFVQTFKGQMISLMAEFDLFDITNPIDQLQKLAEIFDNPNFASPALRKALSGLDLTTAEGRRQAESAIQALFRQMQDGTLTNEQLGDLLPQEFLDALKQIESMIDSADQFQESGQSQNFAINRSITEITGSRIASIMTTQTVWLQSIAESMLRAEEILRQLSIAPGGLRPPALPPGMHSQAATLIKFGDINITVQSTEKGSKELAEDITAQIIQQVNSQLGRLTRQQRVQSGMLVS